MIAIGTACRLEQTVTEEYTAATIGSGMLPVFATPYMAAMMERAAQSCLIPYLDKSMGSVGIRLNITHAAPPPLGMKVYAEAEITSVSENGRLVEFSVRAWDDKGPIGSGTHTRAVINNDKFMEKCQAKLEK